VPQVSEALQIFFYFIIKNSLSASHLKFNENNYAWQNDYFIHIIFLDSPRLNAEVHDKLKTEFSDLQYLILHFSTISDKKCR
jgi:hypothetical protein